MISHTVRVNVYDGTIRVDLPGDDDTAAWDDLTGPDGGVFNGTTIEPWGEDEEDMDRADTALAEFGFERVGPWSDDQEHPTATIRRIRGKEVCECIHTCASSEPTQADVEQASQAWRRNGPPSHSFRPFPSPAEHYCQDCGGTQAGLQHSRR